MICLYWGSARFSPHSLSFSKKSNCLLIQASKFWLLISSSAFEANLHCHQLFGSSLSLTPNLSKALIDQGSRCGAPLSSNFHSMPERHQSQLLSADELHLMFQKLSRSDEAEVALVCTRCCAAEACDRRQTMTAWLLTRSRCL